MGMASVTLIAAWIVVVFIGLTSLLILWHMFTGKIDLAKLISEEDGTASLSRFQFLVFTFVIALSLFLVTVGSETPELPKRIAPGILALLGISGGSYVISKGIQKGAGGKTDGKKDKG
jgi:hypothetical protein